MRKSEKYRKIAKIIQYVGMGIILIGGMFVIYWFGIKNVGETDSSLSMTYMLGMMVLLFAFTIFVVAPMTQKLMKLVIIDSLDGLVGNLKFNSKKGFTKETFESFNVGIDKGSEYGCQDYYSFDYKQTSIESATVNYYSNTKVEKKGKSKKTKKAQIRQFLGRVYVIPYNNETKDEISILGKYNPSYSKSKTMNDYSLYQTKVKKYNEAFEVYYKEKPIMNIQAFLECLYSLKMQAKGTISCIIRKKSLVLCIDNHKVYEEIDIKKPISEDTYRNYRKEVSMVLTFIDMVNKLNQETK